MTTDNLPALLARVKRLEATKAVRRNSDDTEELCTAAPLLAAAVESLQAERSRLLAAWENGDDSPLAAAAKAERESLQAERDQLFERTMRAEHGCERLAEETANIIEGYEATLRGLRARVAELEEALRPLARAGDCWPWKNLEHGDIGRANFTTGIDDDVIRAARRALNGGE